ncbi:MAG: hypothetical protein SVW57_03780, partial [Thermodesulfobacteriota bacterium]|nr:hypothetical protein [Thermodesulfobacteriota bacterium]
MLLTLFPLINACVAISLATFTLLKGYKSRENILFAFFCLIFFFLHLDRLFISIIEDKEMALRISRLDHLFFIFHIPIYIHFVNEFLKRDYRKNRLFILYLFTILFLPVTQTDLYIKDMHSYFFGYFAQGGILFHIFLAFSITVQIYCFSLFFNAFKMVRSPKELNKMRYILLGFGGSIVLTIFDSLPILGIEIYPPGNFVFIPLICLSFGILKYDLLDLGVVIRKSILYTVLTASVTLFYILGLVAFEKIMRQFRITHSFPFQFLFFLFFLLIMNPLKIRVERCINRIFYRDMNRHREAMMLVSEKVITTLDLDEILCTVSIALHEVMGISNVIIALLDSSTEDTFTIVEVKGKNIVSCKGIKFKPSPTFMRDLENHPYLLQSNEKENMWWSDCKELPLKLFIPFVFKGALVGILALGNKKFDKVFSQEDLGTF